MKMCPLYTKSKYAYKPKQKPCPNAGTVQVCLPTDLKSEPFPVTIVAFVAICHLHHAILSKHQIETIKHLNANPDVNLNNCL